MHDVPPVDQYADVCPVTDDTDCSGLLPVTFSFFSSSITHLGEHFYALNKKSRGKDS